MNEGINMSLTPVLSSKDEMGARATKLNTNTTTTIKWKENVWLGSSDIFTPLLGGGGGKDPR